MSTTTVESAGHPASMDSQAFMQWVFRQITSFDGYTAQIRRAWAINAHERLALAALWADGPMTMTQLGAWIPLSRAAVTTLVDRLERDGFVTRGSDPADRRRTVVSVSEDALNSLMPVLQPWADAMHQLGSNLTDEEWKTVSRFLTGISAISGDQATMLKAQSDEELRAQLAART